MPTDTAPAPLRSGQAAAVAVRLAEIAFVMVFTAAILFGAAGTTGWFWGWLFLAVQLAVVLINSLVLSRRRLDTIAERGRPAEFKGWDKVISGLWSLFQYLLLPLAAGLDLRFGWTRLSGAGWNIAGAAVYLCGLELFSWAMITNAFFSTTARVQSERGQTVCRSGPYRFVRHPGYAGAILQSFGTTLLLGSLWALIPATGAAICILVRTILEDRLLQAELDGYAAYALRVRFRWIPGIW
jgi:protein-S-isoprenylcysteine O-methyltransferase Ste14